MLRSIGLLSGPPQEPYMSPTEAVQEHYRSLTGALQKLYRSFTRAQKPNRISTGALREIYRSNRSSNYRSRTMPYRSFTGALITGAVLYRSFTEALREPCMSINYRSCV